MFVEARWREFRGVDLVVVTATENEVVVVDSEDGFRVRLEC